MLTRPQLASGFSRPVTLNLEQNHIQQGIPCDTIDKNCYERCVLLSGVYSTRRQTNVICRSATVADPALPLIMDRNEYRRGVGLCVVNRDGLVFAARRIDDRNNTWQMPQGGIDHLENPLVAALRELHEETGMTSVRIISSIDSWLDYEFPTKVRAQLPGQWVRYRGQTQKWLLLEFLGNDSEIDLSCNGCPEFSEWQWMALEDLPKSVVDFKRDVYEAVANHFCPRIHHLVGREGF